MILFKVLDIPPYNIDEEGLSCVSLTCPVCKKEIMLSKGYSCLKCYYCNEYYIDPASELIDNGRQGIVDYHNYKWPEHDKLMLTKINDVISKMILVGGE